MKLENLLVTTDFSPESKKAYGCAAELSRKFGSTLHLAHVEDALPPIFSDVSAESYFAELEAAVRDEAKDPAFEGVQVAPHLLRSREPFEALKKLEQKEGIDLVVTATHGRTEIERFLLGSFAERVVRTSVVPVLTFRKTETQPAFEPKSVLVPIDFSEQSMGVLSAIRFLASGFGCRFTLLYVEEPRRERVPFTTRLRELLSDSPKRVEDRFAKLKEDELGETDVTLAKREGVPYVEIVRHAKETGADLVLISTHGVLGSVAQNVVRDAPCSVLTMRQASSA